MSDYEPTRPSRFFIETDKNKRKPGLYYQAPADKNGNHKPPLWISGIFEIAARTRDGDSKNHGLLLVWNDLDGKKHEWLMPFDLLAGDGLEIRKTLFNGGLRVNTMKAAKDQLLNYLNESKPENVVRTVVTTGWQVGGVYVLPHSTIGD